MSSTPKEWLEAVLPEWFADAVDASLPQNEMQARLHDFILESEMFSAEEEGRPPNRTPPTPEYVARTLELYRDVLAQLRAG